MSEQTLSNYATYVIDQLRTIERKGYKPAMLMVTKEVLKEMRHSDFQNGKLDMWRPVDPHTHAIDWRTTNVILTFHTAIDGDTYVRPE